MVNRQYDGKLEEILKEKITEVIRELSTYTVFRRKSEWEKEESIAYKTLQEEVVNNRPLIKDKVENIIKNYPFDELKRDEIGDVIYQCVMDKLFDSNKN
jgi:hypothetical protein